MTFIFKDFLAKLFINVIHSMSDTCCAPTDVKDLQLQDPQESKLRDIAKMDTLDDNEHSNNDQNQQHPQHNHHPHLNINNIDFLLISGFLHHIQTKNITQTHTNIHFDISHILCLCISYYYTQNTPHNYMYLLAEHSDTNTFPSLDSDDDSDTDNLFNNYGVYITHTLATNKRKYCANIYELPHADTLSIFTHEWIVKFAALCSIKNIILPCNVHNEIIKAYKRKNIVRNDILREYNIIFKLCGSGTCGWSDACTAVIIDEGYLCNTNMNETIGFNWHLPTFPVKTGGNGVCFDAKYGLISVGGYQSNKVYNLSFDCEAYFEQNYAWIWEQLPSMQQIRWFPSCCVVNDQLIAMAGSSADHEPLCSVECLSLNGDNGGGEWRGLSSCNIARKYGGLMYDNIDDKLYLGGGDYATQSVEFYDICKDKWYNLPNTQLPHKYYPSLWKDLDTPTVLNISCSYSNSIESYDLRTNDKWKLVCANKVFQTDALDLDYNQFRLCL